jgi:hypothetical protein
VIEVALPPLLGVIVPVMLLTGLLEDQVAVSDKVPLVLPVGARVTPALVLLPATIMTVAEPEAMLVAELVRPSTVKVHEPALSCVKENDPEVEVWLLAVAPDGPVPLALYFAIKPDAGIMVFADPPATSVSDPLPELFTI